MASLWSQRSFQDNWMFNLCKQCDQETSLPCTHTHWFQFQANIHDGISFSAGAWIMHSSHWYQLLISWRKLLRLNNTRALKIVLGLTSSQVPLANIQKIKGYLPVHPDIYLCKISVCSCFRQYETNMERWLLFCYFCFSYHS